MSNKSLFGLHENLAGVFAYAGVFVTGIIALVMEKENKFVRFHALQSTVFFGALGILNTIVQFLHIPFLSGLISGVLGAVMFVSYVFLIYSAYKGNMFKIPVLGDIVWEQIDKK